MASRRLVVVPYEMVRTLLEPTIEQTAVLKPTQILRQPLVPATKVALYASALNRQLGIKYPDVAGEASVSIQEQNNSPPPSPTPPTPPAPEPPARRVQPKRGLPSPRTALQRRLRSRLGEFITKENKVLNIEGDVIRGADANKLINYVTNPDYPNRTPRASAPFIDLLRALDIDGSLIANEDAKVQFLRKKQLTGSRLNWDDLGYD